MEVSPQRVLVREHLTMWISSNLAFKARAIQRKFSRERKEALPAPYARPPPSSGVAVVSRLARALATVRRRVHRGTPGLRHKIPVFSDPAPGKS